MKTVAEYREFARLCRELATKIRPNDRRATQLMASPWEQIADEREARLAAKQEQGLEMRIVSQCQDRALVLLQIARENPQFEEQAAFLAREWLAIAALRISVGVTERPEKQVRAN
jgi:hypothetical protein